MASPERTAAGEQAEESAAPFPIRHGKAVSVAVVAAFFLLFHLLADYFPYVIVAAFIAGGVLALVQGIRHARTAADTPTSKIRSAAQGLVEMAVRVVPGPEGPPVAPLSGECCAIWWLEAERLEGSGRKRFWRVRARACSAGPLIRLEDGTGSCLMPLDAAEVTTRSHTRRAGRGLLERHRHRFPPDQRAILAEPGRWRLVERRLPDTTLYALGHFRSMPSSHAPFRDAWGPEGTALDRQWTAAMREAEGIGPDDALGGTVMAHILSADPGADGSRSPLVLSFRSERGFILGQYGSALVGVLLTLAGVGGLALQVAQDVPAFRQWLRALFGLS